MHNILICDDEKDIVSALEIYLKADEYDPANPRYLIAVWGRGYKMEDGNLKK